jgi:membrane protease YdiL (CAAX protease family)
VTRISSTQSIVAGVAILVVYNIARGLGAFGPLGDVSTSLLFAAFVALALRAKLTAVDLGIARDDAARGAKYGILAFLVTTAVLALVAVIPASSDFLDDDRADVSGPRLLFEIAIPVLLLTVIPEEFAFRGVLLASGRQRWGDRGAVLATSALFGLWHVSPTLNTLSENRQLDDATETTGGTILLIAGTVLATFVAGLLFGWLRLRSRSLLAPIIAHLATNGAALAAAWFVVR